MNAAVSVFSPSRRPRHQDVTVVLSIAIVLGAAAAMAHAQIGGHVDVQFGYDSGKIALSQPVYSYAFPKTGISRQFTSNPGFGSETDIGLGLTAGDTVVYHVLDDLYFWDGAAFDEVAPDTQIRIENNPAVSVPDTIVGGGTGSQEGSFDPPRNRIGSALSLGDFHSHVQYQLEPYQSGVAPPPPAYGAYGIKLQLATSAPAIEASDPFFIVFNFGLAEEVFQSGLTAFETLLQTPGLRGDYNGNQQLDAEDLDWQAEVLIGIRPFKEQFDENGDGQVTSADREIWLAQLRQTWVGDSNLDFEFDATDFVDVLTAGQYETGQRAGWAEGDWNGDLRFDTADLVAAFMSAGYEQGLFPGDGSMGPTSVVQVPEPRSDRLVLVALCILAGFLRSVSGQDWTWNSIRQTSNLGSARRCW